LVPSGTIAVLFAKSNVWVLADWLKPVLHLHCTIPSVPLTSVHVAFSWQGVKLVEQASVTKIYGVVSAPGLYIIISNIKTCFPRLFLALRKMKTS